jgi:hypothetical protein
MYIANELLPDIMLSLCKIWGSIGLKAPGLIMKLSSKQRYKRDFNPHQLPPYHPCGRFSNLQFIDRNFPSDSCRESDFND